MTNPVSANPFPYFIEVEAGKSYKWCACGLSKSQPFCDGSHRGTDFEPVIFTSDTSRKVRFCGCKKSKRGPECDGNHNK